MKLKFPPYPESRKANTVQEFRMPRKHPFHSTTGETFGKRLARLRKAAGYTQYTLADETGISKRMIAYYEVQTTHPPTHLLPVFAKILGVTTDQLLGLEKTKETKLKDNRLWRRFSQVEKLPP